MTFVIAHRGASAAFPENTIEAFGGARDLGADWVELDVRRTADGLLAVCHDALLPDGRALVELRGDELPASVPTLGAALDACEGMGVNIEIKNLPDDPDFDPDDHVAQQVGAVVDLRDGGQPILVSSFNLRSIDRLRAAYPTIATAWLSFDLLDVDAAIARTADRGHRAINPLAAFVDGPFVEQAHAAGLAVNAWTVDDADRMAELVALGVDGIVTNVPDVGRAVVDAHAGPA